MVVYLQLKDYLVLSIPNVMLTVLGARLSIFVGALLQYVTGVVIGFVISYRAVSGVSLHQRFRV